MEIEFDPDKRAIALVESALKSDLGKVDAHALTEAEYDEIPELTEEWFATADVHRNGKLVKRGRPKTLQPKEAINIRLDSDLLAYFRSTGPGWQSRINSQLRKLAGI
jgi:uncharacterized protein (DUF4415 family)